MGETTKIEWTDHTFNSWWGCTKVSPGCEHCYAESLDKRIGGDHWGPGKARRIFGEKHWNEPRRWNAAAKKEGRRHRVFCSSMADVFDAEAPAGELDKLWALIRETPHLDWQLLTKRPERILESLPFDWGAGWRNVWLGCTVEDQRRADERIPHLLRVPARVRFLSCEPLLESVDLTNYLRCAECRDPRDPEDRFPVIEPEEYFRCGRGEVCPGIHWVIVGGESGGGSRPFDLRWARSLIDQCSRAKTSVFVKQLGVWPFDGARWPEENRSPTLPNSGVEPKAHPLLPLTLRKNGRQIAPFMNLRDPKGGDVSEWPDGLGVREFPAAPKGR